MTVVLLPTLLGGCGIAGTGVDIWKAVEQENLASIRLYAERGGNLEAGATIYGKTPLLHALNLKKKASYQQLLDLKASPNTICEGGAVVMDYAAHESELFWLKQALAAEGDPNIVNEGASALKKGTPLHFAMSDSRLENVKLLYQAGADINAAVDGVPIPLAGACDTNSFQVVLYFLNQGADYMKSVPKYATFVERLQSKLRIRHTMPPDQQRGLDEVIEWLRKDGFDVDKAVWDGSQWRMP